MELFLLVDLVNRVNRLSEGELQIGVIETLAPTADVTASITGEYPLQHLNLGIPRGVQGEPGQRGAGFKLAMGSVIVSNDGSANAELVGSTYNKVLNLVIPGGAQQAAEAAEQSAAGAEAAAVAAQASSAASAEASADALAGVSGVVSAAEEAGLAAAAAEAAAASALESVSSKADLVDGVVPTSQIPAVALTKGVPVANEAAMLALTNVEPGDIAVRADGAGSFILTATPISTLANWTRLNAPTDVVTSVNGQVGTVVLGKADVGMGSVDNTSDAGKPVSAAQAAAIAGASTTDRARANHTGSQPASTISDLASTVKAYKVTEFAQPDVNLPMNSKRIVSLANPVDNQDAATKQFVLDRTVVQEPSWLNSNLIPNNGFESWSDASNPQSWGSFWGAGTKALSQGTGRSGVYSARATMTGAADQLLDCSPFRVTPQQTYYAEAYFRRGSAAATVEIRGVCGSSLAIYPFGADVLEAAVTGPVSIPAGTGWTKVGFFFTPQNPASTYCSLHINMSTADSWVEIDDVVMVPVVQTPNQKHPFATTLANIASGTSETVIAKFLIPAGTMAANDVLEWLVHGRGSSTATLAAKARLGPLGTTADPLILSYNTTAAGVANRQSIITGGVGILTTGAAGTLAGFGTYQLNAAVTSTADSSTTPSVDTTVDNYLSITLTQSATQAFTTLSGRLRKTRGVE